MNHVHDMDTAKSVCCYAKPIEDTDICSKCRDHSGFEFWCLDCDYHESVTP